MAQISKGDTFTDGQQVTGTRLNQLVDSSVLLVGAITDQPSITANTLQATDTTIVNDAGVLKEATIGDFLNSNLPISTSAITGGTGVDLVLTPAAGQKVDVAGNIEADDINVTDDLTVGDDATISGDLVVTGGSTLTGNVVADNGFTSNGVANFTGTLQVNGTVGYVLTEIVEQSMSYSGSPASGSWTNCFTSASYIKPAGEIWVLEVDFRFRTQAGVFTVIRLNQTSTSTTLNGVYNIEGAGSDYFHCENAFLRYVVADATTFTSTFTLDVQPNGSGYVFTIGEAAFPYAYFTGVTLPVSKFRIYKYKTA
jgi:hypothetical protein